MAVSSSTITALKRAINAANKQIYRHAGQFEALPQPTNFALEMSYIQNSEGRAKERIRALQRMMPSHNPHAWDTVTFHGMQVPKFYKNEIRNITRQINKERQAIRKTLYPEFDLFTPIQKATIYANKNLNDLDETDALGNNGEFEAMQSELYTSETTYAEIYISVWEDNDGDPFIADMIREMAENDPEGFHVLRESPDIQKDIEYIYPNHPYIAPREHYTYKRQSAFLGDVETRYKNAANWWIRQYNDYKTQSGYFRK